MPKVTAHATGLTIVFAVWEAPFVGRRRLDLDRAEIEAADVVERPLRHQLGPRAGFWITGLVKVGLFGTARRCLTSVRRGTPALHVRVRGSRPFHEVLVSTPDARNQARALTTLP